MRLKKYLKDKSWEENIDKGIPIETMKKINDLDYILVVSSCSGHEIEGPSLFFQIKQKALYMLSFEESMNIFNFVVDHLNLKLDDSHSKWIYWLNPTEFLYDSDNRI